MVPVVEFLGLTLPVGPLFALLAFYMGSELGSHAMTWWGRETADEWSKAFSRATLIGVIVGLLGARLGYASTHAGLYLAEPWLLFSPRPSALMLGPGLVLGILVGGLVLHRARIPLGRASDAAAVGAACALAILSIGDFFTGNAYGLPTQVPWAVEMWGAPRHPMQIYMAVALLFICALLWWRHGEAATGQLFWRFIMLYSLSQLFLDGFRADSPTWEGFRIVQIVALASTLAAMVVLSSYAQSQGSLSNVQSTEQAV